MSALDKIVEMFPGRIAGDIDLSEYRDDSYKVRVKEAREYRDELLKRLRQKEAYGDRTGFVCDENFRFRPFELTIWTGFKGHGKALAIDTPIPTPNGWSLMGDLNVGDVVFDENGRCCNVVAATDVMYGRPCYELVFSDGSRVVADENHQWLTSNYAARMSESNFTKKGRNNRPVAKRGTDQSEKRKMPSIVTTGEISKTLRVYETTKANALNHAISSAGAIELPDSDFDIAPYLLGAWLGDGSSRGSRITIAEQAMLDQVLIRAGKYEIKKNKTKYSYGINGGMIASLRKLGLINNKHIPEKYLRGSYSQRIELLRGLLDTDGHVDKNGRVEFCNTNHSLAEGVYELACSLGIVPTMITGRATLKGVDCGEKYRVFFTTNLPVFSIPRKLEKIKQSISVRNKRRFVVSCEKVDSVPVKCIQVDSPSHLFLATKAFIPTHNSALLSQVLLKFMQSGKKCFVVSPEFPPVELLFRFLVQCIGSSDPTEEEADVLLEFLSGSLWIYDVQASLKPGDVAPLCRWVMEHIKPDHIVIDSLMKCGIAPDDYASQKKLVDQIQSVAHQHPVHIHLVAHARKGSSDEHPAKLHDVKGASEIADMAENVVSVWRNKPKEKARSMGDSSKDEECDAMFVVEAQRNCGGWIGSMPLNFERSAMIFFEPGRSFRSYVSISSEVEL